MTPKQLVKLFVHNYIEHGERDVPYNDHKSVHFQREQKHIIFAGFVESADSYVATLRNKQNRVLCK